MIIERVPQPPRKNASGWREEPRSGVEAVSKAEDGDELRQDPYLKKGTTDAGVRGYMSCESQAILLF